jgi:hypothetical protein
MSALPPKADMCGATNNVCFGPIADITTVRPMSALFAHKLGAGSYLAFSQTRIPTPSRPSTGLLLGAVLIVRVSPSNL